MDVRAAGRVDRGRGVVVADVTEAFKALKAKLAGADAQLLDETHDKLRRVGCAEILDEQLFQIASDGVEMTHVAVAHGVVVEVYRFAPIAELLLRHYAWIAERRWKPEEKRAVMEQVAQLAGYA